MTLQIRLYGALRDTVPNADRGRLEMTLTKSMTIAALLARLELSGHVQVAVNGEVVPEWDHLLHNADVVEIFQPAAGG